MNAPMNRAQRRAMKHRKLVPDRVLGLPSLIDEMTVFSAIERILDKLATGGIEAVNGVPVFLDDEGCWSKIGPALDGWIGTWDRITNATGDALNQQPLRVILRKLIDDELIAMEEIAQAHAVIDRQRRIFRTTPRQRLCELTQTEQIAMYLEETKNG